jgi:hypothetical protein
MQIGGKYSITSIELMGVTPESDRVLNQLNVQRTVIQVLDFTYVKSSLGFPFTGGMIAHENG